MTGLYKYSAKFMEKTAWVRRKLFFPDLWISDRWRYISLLAFIPSRNMAAYLHHHLYPILPISSSCNVLWVSYGLHPCVRRKTRTTSASPSVNPSAPNDVYTRTAQLTSRRCILNIYSTNILTEYFKHAAHSPFSPPLQDAVYFIMLSFLVPVIFTFYIQGVLKF